MRRATLPATLAAILLCASAVASTQSASAQSEGVGSTVTVVGGDAAVATAIFDGVASCATTTRRIAGPDRYGTAAALAEDMPDDAPVYLASGADFPDALAAGPVVADAGGVLLLTAPDALPEVTADAITARDPDEVIVLGGPGAISRAVETEVEALGPDVRRVRGPDRYATAAALVAGRPAGDPLLVVSGATYADALAAGPFAARTGAAMLLTDPATLPDVVADAVVDLAPSRITVVGGAAAVGEAVEARLRQVAGDAPVDRVAGADRADTAARLAADAPPATGVAWLATGSGFADALAAAPSVAAADAPLLLVDDDLPPATAAALLAAIGSDCRHVDVGVTPAEAATLGPSSIGGTTLTGRLDGQEVHLDHADDRGSVLLAPDRSGTITFAYPTPLGDVPAVTWDQVVAGDATAVDALQPWRGQRPPPEDDITLAWQYTGDSDRYRAEVDAAPGLTVTAPFRWFLNGAGEVVGAADPAFVADMHARGIEVWPTVHTCGDACIHAALADPARRSAHAHRIAAEAIAAGADGINIDIEGFQVADRDAVTSFVEELSSLVQAEGLVTSFDFTVMTDTWHTPPAEYAFWSTGPDRRAISEAVDYAVLMAYDEFNRFRPRGPVASRDWVEEALRYQLRHSDADRVLLGVPLYGRVWTDADPTAVGIGTTEALTAQGQRTPDPAAGVDRVDLADGRVTWAETIPNLGYRVDLVEAFGLAGTASWRLGFDAPGVWPVLARGD